MEQNYLHFRRKKRRHLKKQKRKRMATLAGAVVLVCFIAVGFLPSFGIISPGTITVAII